MQVFALAGLFSISLYGLVTAIGFRRRDRVPWWWAIAPSLILVGVVIASVGLRSEELSSAYRVAFAAAAVASATLSGGIVSLAVLDVAFPSSKLDGLPGAQWIGFIERLSFTLALLLGLAEVAAVVLAVKALGQYAGANNTLPATRVVGTLASITWALACFSAPAVAGTYIR